ncbi:autophagy-related protein 33 [Emericellopsis cladophorae]|uniref:Autophagy-related protein 33 n=1 Tax=Emericellopsis cladophorae TaxID=2686198 RepID=A0A9P9Y5D8_9HYPO|nr:autophagy-related protein 33 [Emericellopsis cladophorae]KAI6783822.1 autophagy-related protein 33 [Emericellopsis cladophorae]
MSSSAVSAGKFVGTVSLGLLTGVSYSASTLVLPTIMNLPSAASASHALTTFTSYVRLPVLALSALSSLPLLLSFALSPRSSRHPYLIYTSLIAALSVGAPALVPVPTRSTPPAKKPKSAPRAMEQSYEVLGDAASEAPSEEEIDDFAINGEEVRAEAAGTARGFMVRTGVAALGFAMAVVGIWGDGAPQAVVLVS